MPLLKEFIPPPDRFQLQGTDDLPAQFDDVAGKQIMLRVAETEQAGWHDLLLLLQLTEQQSLKFTAATNRLTPGSAAVLLGQLLQGDFLSPEDMIADRVTGVVPKKPAEKLQFDSTIRPFGLLTFSRGAGLINAHSDSLTALGRAFLTSQDPELLLQAFEKWTREGTFDEITRIDAMKGLRSHGL